MDVGILTLYKVRNIGAGLQAVAMKSILEGKGHRVFFIDGYDSAFAKQLFRNDMGKIRPWNALFWLQKDYKFRSFFPVFPEVSLQDTKGLDGVIIGSDSVWVADYGKDPMPTAYFGDIPCATVCSYAPSVGGKYDLKKYTNQQLTSLKRLNYITVRDASSRKFVQEVLGQSCSVVLDPTLLCDWTAYLQKLDKAGESKAHLRNRGDYLLVYGGFNRQAAAAIHEIGRKERLKVVNIGTFNRWFRTNVAVSPNDFLQYIKHAKYVITSMFHGVMLSVALGKEFRYISVDPNRYVKVSTLMDSLDLRAVMLKKQEIRAETLFAEKIDFNQVNARLDDLRKFSGKELDKMLLMMSERRAGRCQDGDSLI